MTTKKLICSARQGLWLGGFGILLSVLLASPWHQINAAPVASTAPSTVPSHNAYDYYVKAGQAMVVGTPAADPIYGRGTKGRSANGEGAAQDEHLYPLAAKQALLRRNATTLALVRQAFHYSYVEPPPTPGSDFPRNARFRELARLLIVDSHAHSQQGDWRGAADSALDAMQLGHDVGRGRTLISALVSYAIQSLSHRELWRILPHLDASAARAATVRLQGLLAHRVALAVTMANEKQYVAADLRHGMRHRNWRKGFSDGLTAQQKRTLMAIPSRTIIANYNRLMDTIIANCRRPYRQQRPVPPPGDPVTAEFASAYSLSRWVTARNDANVDLLLVALALRAYQLEHGTYPKQVADLVPTYLTQVPPDPFGSGEPLRYRVQDNTYVLWSIGPDGVDNGGQPIHDAKAAAGSYPEAAGRVLMESKGDIVAGINR